MSALKYLELSSEEMDRLRRKFSRIRGVTPYHEMPAFAGQVASIGIAREVGTMNDELARFVFDADRGEVVPVESLQATLVQLGDFTGVKITSSASDRLDIRARGVRDLLHPDFSFNPDGTVRGLVIFPELISRILGKRGVELVLVQSWGMNSIFGGFDPSKAYYQTNFWEIENNDALLFSRIVKEGQLALLGTHDLIAHAAGVRAQEWRELQGHAARVHTAISNYFASVSRPSIAALILPYTIGVVLDDLAQPPSYGSRSHLAVLDELLRELEGRTIPANLSTLLTEFPGQFQKIIEMSRIPEAQQNQEKIAQTVREMTFEIQRHSLLQTG